MKLFAVIIALLLPQSQQTTPTFLETLDVRITNVDVVVTDRAGKSVRGLHRDDFVVTEDGAPQTITNFAEYGGSVGQALLPVVPGSAPAPIPPSAEVLPSRKFLFFIDEMSLSGSTTKQLVESATALVRNEMRPGDEAMVVTRAKSTKVALDFTADRALTETRLREALERQSAFRANDAEAAERVFFNSIGASSPREFMQSARIYATRTNRRVTSTLRTLLGLVGAMNQTSGRKVLVVLSESLSDQPGREAFQLETINTRLTPSMQVLVPDYASETMESAVFDAAEASSKATWYDVRPMIAELAARASANGVTIYTLQPDFASGVQSPAAGADQSGRIAVTRRGGQGSRAGGFAVDQFHRTVIDDTRGTLQTLADDTGGKFFIGARELAGGFRQIAEDLTSYYSLGYRSAGEGEHGIRKIAVRVNGHPDYAVRARREMLRRSPEREMDEMVAANLIAPRAVNELGIAATTGKPERGHDSVRIAVVVKVPLSKLTFIPDGDKYRAAFTIHYAAADGADYTKGIYREQTLEIPASAIDAARQRDFTYTSILVVAPGTLKVSVGVYDKYSRLTGFQQIEVKL